MLCLSFVSEKCCNSKGNSTLDLNRYVQDRENRSLHIRREFEYFAVALILPPPPNRRRKNDAQRDKSRMPECRCEGYTDDALEIVLQGAHGFIMRMPEDHAAARARVIILEHSLMRLGEPGGLQRPEIVPP